MLLTTHYLDEADRLASRLAIVDRGRVVAEGDPERLKRSSEPNPWTRCTCTTRAAGTATRRG